MHSRVDEQACRPSVPAGISRRAFIGLCAGAALITAGGGSTLLERRDTLSPVLREVVVPVVGLRRELSLVQATDLHAQSFGQAERGLAALLEGRQIDAAVMTGDILDESVPGRQPAYDLADALTTVAPRVYFLPGNHDPADLGTALARHGVTPLQHAEPVSIAASDPMGREVALVYGVDSASIAGASGYGSKLLVIASHTPPNESRLAAGAALGPGARIFVAGHTHGGQIRIPGLGAVCAPMSWEGEEGGQHGTQDLAFLPDLKGKFVDGLYERQGQRVFVCVGLGMSRPRARVWDRAELALLRFVPRGA